MMRSVDSNAEHFILAIKVSPADSVIRYREDDYNETVFIKGDGNATPATPEEIQPVVSIYPGFLNLKLFDRLYRDEDIELDLEGLTDVEKVIAILKMEGPKPIRELQTSLNYRSRSQFLNEVINPLIETGKIYRDGKPKSPNALIKIKR